ncbi:MAG: hypothetical protein A2X00_00980 [Bacteroidetes bacterium GWE2_32_14]|nr:MAG: hypothetical protein A2X00_00980 [Bacteroidetes bacterium GWE2_32_14]
MFLLALYLHNIQVSQLIKKSDLNDDIESALNIYLTTENFNDYNKEIKIDLFEDGEHNVSLLVKKWGLYDIAYLNAKWKNININKAVLVGNDISENDEISIYYTNSAEKLTLCGNSLIEGNAFLPEKNVERGYIDGKGYNGEELIYGNIGYAEYSLPELNIDLIDEIENNYKKSSLSQVKNYNEYVNSSNQVIDNLFTNEPIILYSDLPLEIESVSLFGNIVVFSEQAITIKNTSKIQDAILIANQVNIESGFKGNFQVFCTDSIIVEENVSLLYPTVLLVNSIDKAKISIGNNSLIFGDIILYNSNVSQNAKILLEEGSIIQGLVYSYNKIEPKGSIYGSLYCNKIELITKSSSYSGHLMNAVISFDKLSKDYSFSNILKKESIKKAIKGLK